MYPIAIFDALRVKITDAESHMVKNWAVYGAPSADMAEAALNAFEETLAGKNASVAPDWCRTRQEVIPFFAVIRRFRLLRAGWSGRGKANAPIERHLMTRV
jgi:transposase-like protein